MLVFLIYYYLLKYIKKLFMLNQKNYNIIYSNNDSLENTKEEKMILEKNIYLKIYKKIIPKYFLFVSKEENNLIKKEEVLH